MAKNDKNDKKANFFVIAIALFSVFVVACGVAFALYFTNNFSTDLTTFYVQYGAQEIRRDTGRMQFDKGVYYTFKVNYPLGFPSNEKGERYKVSIEVNEAGKEIEYKVDGSNTRFYPKPPDISKSFNFQKDTDSFTFCIPKGTTLAGILKSAYEEKNVENIPFIDLAAKDYFSLVVKNYDESVVIRIGFGFDGKYFSGEQQNPSESEEITDIPEGNYAIRHDTSSWILFEGNPYAAPGTEQAVAIAAADSKTYQVEAVYIQAAAYPQENKLTDMDGDGVYYFTMPDCDVFIRVILSRVDGQPEYWL